MTEALGVQENCIFNFKGIIARPRTVLALIHVTLEAINGHLHFLPIQNPALLTVSFFTPSKIRSIFLVAEQVTEKSQHCNR